MKSGEDQSRPHPPDADKDPPGPTDPADSSGHDLARELTGDLPCIACGYNLRSISVLSVCPECATPVRATLLARVDPYAGVLRPIDRPILRSAGLLLWSVAALGAALATWGIRLADAVEVLTVAPIDASRLILAGCVLIALSGLGAAITLIRPHTGIPPRQIALAVMATLAYMPLFALYWQLHAMYDPPRIRPYLESFTPDAQRAVLRILAGLMMIVIVVGLRPNLRLLTARSLLLRMGRVDRQTMLGLAAAIGVAIAGDLLHILSADLAPRPANAAFLLGVVLIAVGSMLVTVGIVGIVIDCFRILPVVLRAPISYRQVLGNPAHINVNPARPDPSAQTPRSAHDPG